ncbi:MAG TPA: class I SAM-dependent methyltransferase [Acetobacteraceae bacterium]|nr:class I SAM-dependent methyltransferase [Acetobacteraceae bacterium]
MTPDDLARVRDLIGSGELDDALARLAASWDPTGPLAPDAADLKALALDRKGDVTGALEPLRELVANGTATFHTYYRLAEYYRRLGQIDQTVLFHRLAHAKFDWPESLAHGYCFTHDYFSPNIRFWQTWFRDHITAAPLEALEIGSWQGGSATWLLDNVISRRGGRLTCIDAFEGSSEHVAIMASLGSRLQDLFDDNVLRTGHDDKVRKLVGYSQAVLPSLWGEKFDFIYIDGAHEAKFVIQDAALCWGLLRPGGFMLFDDVNFTFANHPEQNTVRAIDFFLSVFADDLNVIDRRHQLLVQRAR